MYVEEETDIFSHTVKWEESARINYRLGQKVIFVLTELKSCICTFWAQGAWKNLNPNARK